MIDRLNAALSGRYEVEREVGEGGMATVFLARDLKHNRRVALKVLKPELAAVVGAERFLAEIETTANLQHPNILPLYDSGEADTFLYYVMPYVEGQTLRDRLDTERQLPVDEALRVATAVANALDFAHGHGVVHRDIKPGNILFQGGQPVVGDFGIALAVGAGGGARLTETGLSVGTPYYMSPEQATGDQTVGARSDIYSLGCVLYEMLVGDPPYLGSTAQAVLGQIISGRPPAATEKRAAVPPHVDAAIRRALEKVPADRFATAAEFAAALADPAFRHGGGAALPGGGARPWKVATAAASVVAVLALGWAVSGPGATHTQAPRRFRIEVPGGDPQGTFGAALSPDGSRVVWGLGERTGEGPSVALWLQTWDGLPPRPIEGADGTTPVFAPDGRRIAFMDGGDLRVVDVEGGRPRTIQPGVGFTAIAWGDDGFIYGSFGSTDKPVIVRVPEEGGEAEEVTTAVPGRQHRSPVPLPEGRGLLYVSQIFGTGLRGDSIGVFDARSHEQRTLFPGTYPWYSPSGHLMYVSQGRLTAVPFDLETLEVSGSPTVITDDVIATEGSPSGAFLYAEGNRSDLVPELVWVGRDSTEEVVPWPLSPGPGPQDPALSPDGRRLFLGIREGDSLVLHVRNLADGATIRLGTGSRLVWSADGREVGFNADGLPGDPDGTQRMYRQAADGSSPPVPITVPLPTAENDDGRWSLEQPLVYGTPTGLAVVEPGDSVPVVVLDGEGLHDNPTLSPDGRWVAFATDVSGERRVFVRPYPEVRSALYPISTGYGADPQWSPDGRTLYYEGTQTPGSYMDVMAAHLETEPSFEVVSREVVAPFQRGYQERTGGWLFTVGPDGRVLVIRWRFDPPQVTGFVFVQDLAAELRARLGGGQ